MIIGRIPPRFFAILIDSELLRPEVGEQIATELIDWLPKHDLERLHRTIEKELDLGVLRRFEAICRDNADQRNYPCDYD